MPGSKPLSHIAATLLYLLTLAGLAVLVIQLDLPDSILLLALVPIIIASYYYSTRLYIIYLLLAAPVTYFVIWQISGSHEIAFSRTAIALVVAATVAEVTFAISRRWQLAEEMLRKSHEQYRTLLENLNDVAFVIDVDQRFTYISPAVAFISHYTADDLLGQPFTQFVHPEDIALIEQSYWQAVSGQTSLNRFRMQDKDGSFRYVRTSIRRLTEGEKFVGVSGILMDVTDMVKAEEELHAGQRHMAAMNEITRAALQESDFRSMLQTLANHMGEMFSADGCFLTLWDDDRGQPVPAAAYGPMREDYPKMVVLPGDRTITSAVLTKGSPILVADLQRSPYIEQRLANQFSVKSLLALPLIAGGQKMGAVLIGYNDSHVFNYEEINRAGQMASQVALALAKARLLEAERRQRQIADHLQEAGAVLSASLDLDQVLDQLLPQLWHIIKFDAGSIFLVEGPQARVVRSYGYSELYGPDVASRINTLEYTIAATPNLRELLHKQTPLVIPNLRQFQEWIPVEGVDRMLSWVGVPLVVGGNVLGIFSLEQKEANYFTDKQLRDISAYAAQAALALQNARLYEDTQRRMRESETLRQASTAVVSELNLEKVLDRILEELELVIPYDSASVFVVKRDSLTVVAARGFDSSQQVIGLTADLETPLFKEITVTRKPLILRDAMNDSRFSGWADTGNVRGWMGVPLISQGEIIGQLTVDSYQIGAYTDEHARLVMDFATETSIALRHATLYHQAVDTATRLSILHEASQRVNATLDPQQLYQAIHHAAAQVMPTESFVISLLDEEVQEIEVVYLVDRFGRSPVKRIPLGRGLSGHIIATGKSVRIVDAERDTTIENIQVGDPDPVMSFIGVPMRRQNGSVFGMVSAQSYLTDAYTLQDLELLELLAAHASIALDNTRLFGELQRLAVTDPLTGVYNRRHFFDLAHREFDRSRRYQRQMSVLIMDIDHFKLVNDRFGHLVGDQVLRAIAERCRESVRDVDVFARFGGEEFVLLIPETGSEGARQVANRLHHLIADTPVSVNDISVEITVSIGVASLPGPCEDLDCLISMADQSLYMAKAAGRNTVAMWTNPDGH